MWNRLFDSKTFRDFGTLGDWFVTTLLWLVFSLPLVTIGASSTALFYCYLKRIQSPDLQAPLYELFLRSFKENLRQAGFLWLVYLFLAFDAGLVVWYFYQLDDGWAGMKEDHYLILILAIFLVLYLFTLFYVFPQLSILKVTSRQCISNGVGMSFRFILSTLAFILLFGLLAFLIWIFPPAAVIAPGFYAWLTSKRYWSIFVKCMGIQQKRSEAEESETRQA